MIPIIQFMNAESDKINVQKINKLINVFSFNETKNTV